MRLSNAFDKLARENSFLRHVTMSLLLISALLVGVVYNLYDKQPLIVERSSRGLEIVRSTASTRSQDDLKNAVTLMTKARFDSNTISPELLLNQKQLVLRDTEQKDMKARGLNQTAVIRGVTFESDQIFVEFDRVIAIGDLRSALRTKIKVSFEEVNPNELNPYGLLLSVAEPVEQREKIK